MAVFRIGRLGLYLARQNFFLMAVCLVTGTVLYLLMDLFDRLDDFVSAGLGLGTILVYYGVKLPLIVSQIMPAVFLIALVIQLGLLARSRELLALRSGGVSLGWFLRFFVLLGILWSLTQLGFSQYVGVWGEREAGRIWKEDVRGRQINLQLVKDVWFKENNFIIEVGEVEPARGLAHDITAYEFNLEGKRLERVINAEQAVMDPNGWALSGVVLLNIKDFSSTQAESLYLPLEQNMAAFAAVEKREDQTALPLWDLGRLIDELERSGSNVEQLKTAWHGKWAYAFIILVMSLVALSVLTSTENVYVGVALALVFMFCQYSLHTVGISAGNQGILPPILAAWMSNLVFAFLALFRLWWVSSWKLHRALRKTGTEVRRRAPRRPGFRSRNR